MSNRIEELDKIKTVAIFCVILGHCIQVMFNKFGLDYYSNIIFKFIYSFHLPLFMLVSGYLFYFSFSKRTLKELIIHRVSQLAIPLICGNIFIYLLTDVLLSIPDISLIMNKLVGGEWLNSISMSGLWFLWGVLGASIIVAIIFKCIHLRILQIIFMVVALPLMAVFVCGNNNMYIYPYFLLGFLYNKYRLNISRKIKKFTLISLSLLFVIMLPYYETKHYIYTTGLYSFTYGLLESISIDLFRWIIGLCGSAFVILVIKKINFITVTLGRESLALYCLQNIFILSYLPFFIEKLNFNFPLSSNITLIILFISLIIAIVNCWLMLKMIHFMDFIGIKKYIF